MDCSQGNPEGSEFNDMGISDSLKDLRLSNFGK